MLLIKKKSNWGGKRTGAGRKKLPAKTKRETLNARIMPDTMTRIDKKRGNISRGKYIDSIVP